MKATSTGTSRILIFTFAAVFLVASSIFSLVLTSGTPVVPETFYGTLTINGNPAPVGTQMKGLVGSDDRTDSSPYTTTDEGQYGSDTFIGKFGVLCDPEEQITFAVEKSPGSGQFQNVAGPECNAGAQNVNLDLIVTTGEGPVCGDLSCNGDETCSTCPGDCGTCPPVCGDLSCNGTETCSTCPQDCGACPPVCGDLSCNGDETCSSCPGDCGACPPTCGDQSCNDDETCSNCPGDCGPCPVVCGNDIVEAGETCELPSTTDNPFCSQSTSLCSEQGHKLGTRDAFGNCNQFCGCIQDQPDYSCVAGECGAECSMDSDCNDGNESTLDTCLSDCTCQHTAQGQYCLVITSMRVLNATFDQDSTIPAGTMYNVEMSTYNNCEAPVSTMQIVQVLKGAMPMNLGTMTSTIEPAQTSTITVGFIMPPGTAPGTEFTAKGFNWNHWIDQSPGTFEILSGTGQAGFQSA